MSGRNTSAAVPEASAADSGVIDLRALVDDQGFNRYRLFVLFLIFLAMFADGYDGASISYAAPLITKAWQLKAGAMGSVFAVNVTGILIGSGLLGILGDWIGRRRALILSILLCGMSIFGTVFATNIASLTVWRFFTGLGVGALAPVCLVVANEYSPRRIRATVIAVMFYGFGVGGLGIGGIINATLGQYFGWQALFYFGGAVSLAIGTLLLIWLPESLKYLYVKKAALSRISEIARKLQPNLIIPSNAVFIWSGEMQAEHAVPYRMIFTSGRWKLTLALWLTYFCLQIDGYAVSMWLPTLLNTQGLSSAHIGYAMTLFGAFGIFGANVSARFMDKFGVIVHAVLPLVGIPLVFLVGSQTDGGGILIAAIAATGFSLVGSQIGMNVMVGFFYPTAIRSTGVGLATFVSRFGSMFGATLLGVLLSHSASVQTIFRVCAIPLGIASVSMLALGVLDRRRVRLESLALSGPKVRFGKF
jgi:AAHS family 4-hydroxybenzoate transporter-like MFS transporter